MEIVSVKNLCKKYPSFYLDNVSFTLEEGKIIGFIGRNGAGKTTTIKSMLGFVHSDSGEICIFGKNYGENELEIKQNMGYVSGGFLFYPNKKLKDITGVTASFYQNWDDGLYKKYMEKFHLDEAKTPSKLSEGMKVKYSIVLALSHHAKLLILDEPTSGLDPVSREELLDIFLELKKEGVTIFFSTHITSDLEKCADDIIYIQMGKILKQAGLNEFLKDYSYMAKAGKEADLETIMIQLEKEGGSWEG